MGCTDRIIHKFRVSGKLEDGVAVSLDESGKGILRVPLKEPVAIRNEYD